MKFIGFYDYTVVLTYVSLVSAFLGMTLAAGGSFGGAVACLMLSGLCDAFDGMVARSKKNRTADEKAFGIQLDSLCDAVSFGVFPAYLCRCMGVDGVFGTVCACLFCICAVIRLAYFNVLEGKRQQTEGGINKFYRGLPVTSVSMILPPVYLLRFVLSEAAFVAVLHGMLLLVAFLFVLDFKVPKLDLSKLLRR